MKTRYDGVIAVERRALDQKASEIRKTADTLATLDERMAALEQNLRLEAAVAATSLHFPVHAYAERLRQHRDALREDRRKADMLLSILREQAADACGRVTAIEELAEQDRAGQRLLLQRVEQAVADDLAAAAMVRRARAAARRQQP